MFGIKKLKEEIQSLKNDVYNLTRRVSLLENPTIYKKGQTLWYYDEPVTDNPIECKCLGLNETKLTPKGNIRRYYFIEMSNETCIIDGRYLYDDKNKAGV